MNLIYLYKEISLELQVYLYLISDVYCDKESTDVYSKFDKIDILDRYEEGKEVLKNLSAIGSIRISKTEIIVGQKIGRTYRLFSAQITDPKKDFNKIISYAEEFATYNGLGKAVLSETISLIATASENTEKELLKFFRCCYECVHQISMERQFTGKEIGQMRHMIKNYDSVTIMRMIIYSFTKTKDNVTVGYLLVKADELNKKINSVTAISRTKSEADF